MKNPYLFHGWAGLFLALGLTADALAEPAFVGHQECGVCHRDQTADWEKSSHARAFELLKPGKRGSAKQRAKLDPDRDYSTDPYCIKCHVTGYEKPSGYVDPATTPELAGIGCEMCHGAGKEYVKLHKNNTGQFTEDAAKAAGQTYGSQDPAVCERCHGESAGSPFTPALDSKYQFTLQDRLKMIRSFHRYYGGKYANR